MWRTRWALIAALVVAGACSSAPARTGSATAALVSGPSTMAPATSAPTTVASTTTTVVTTTRPPTTRPAPPPPTVAPTTLPTAPPTTQPRPRVVHEQAWTPFATAGGGQVVLHHPSSRVELVGFHESNNDGARGLDPLPTAVSPVTLEGRERGTGARTAADVVVDPDSEIRAAVTGRVLRAGTYVLYCHNKDDFAVIEPDSHPGWEVKMLHINGVQVRAGQRVVAGETVVAPRATVLPFASQVEEVTGTPPWPHVHIEVVDPTIRDRPSPGC